MKTYKLSYIFFITLLFFQAQHNGFALSTDYLRPCKSDSECTAIPIYCNGWASVNVRYQQEAREHFDRVGAIKSCRNNGETPKPAPRCIDHFCEPAYAWERKKETDAPDPAAPLVFTISSDKTEYRLGEPVIIHIELKNVAYLELTIIDLNKAYAQLTTSEVLLVTIKNSNGEKLPFHRIADDHWPGDLSHTLKQWESIKTDLTLNDESQPNYAVFNKPGVYTISMAYVDYFPYEDYMGEIPEKRAYSNILTIRIV